MAEVKDHVIENAADNLEESAEKISDALSGASPDWDTVYEEIGSVKAEAKFLREEVEE